MACPFVIIITGPPGSGKTTLGSRIAHEFTLPFLSKDGIKEVLFDSLGWSDREWSGKLGIAGYNLLFYSCEALLPAGCSHVIEANFYPQYHTQKFVELHARYPFTPLQIVCLAAGELLLNRIKTRMQAGQRHPGHVEHSFVDGLKPDDFSANRIPLSIGGTILEVDTTDFSSIDYDCLFDTIRAANR